MKYLFFVFLGITLFFSFSAGHVTPAIVVNNDKAAHFIVFLVLSFCMNVSFPTNAIKNLIIAMVLLAVGIEVFQHLFADRELSVLDLGASLAGVFVYVMLFKMIDRQYKIIERSFNLSF